ncbi:adenosine deaminase [Candidatus Sumerlaeota bacterium]|nr:adenosine deaminase [Candidatus Sumerlaeota bacterium]
MEVSQELLLPLPKTDLHCHLDGSLRIETMLELAEEQKVNLPANDPDSLRALVVKNQDNCKSLEEYLKAFEITLMLLQTREALTRVAYELLEDCAKENVWYIEVRFSPILHTKKGLKLIHIMDAVIEGLARGEKDFGVKWGIIISGIREISPDISVRLAELCVAYKNRGVVGFDLAGSEEAHPAKEHLKAFYTIINNNINCTVHAGESFGPESIHQALHYLRTHRLGHAVRLKENGDLLNYVNDHRIPLEICLSSNVHTHAVPDYEHHPLRFYYDYGLRVTINTDNRLVSDTTVTKELYLASKHLNFTLDEIKNLLIFGFKSTFLPYHHKVKMLNAALKKMAEISETKTEDRL